MARREQDREDLLAEATALVERVELQIPGEVEPVVLGIRASGCLSLYFGADPAVHFNSQGELRRGFVNGDLLTAARGRLVRVERRREPGEVQLWRQPLDESATQQLLNSLGVRLANLSAALRDHQHVVLRQVPEQPPLNAAAWLKRIPGDWKVAEQPNAR